METSLMTTLICVAQPDGKSSISDEEIVELLSAETDLLVQEVDWSEGRGEQNFCYLHTADEARHHELLKSLPEEFEALPLEEADLRKKGIFIILVSANIDEVYRLLERSGCEIGLQ